MTPDKKQKIWIKCKRELLKSESKLSIHDEQVVTLPLFQLDDNWVIFLSRLENYFKDNNVKSDRQVPIFLTSISEPTYDLVKKLCRPELPNKKTFKQLISLLTKHFSEKKSWKERVKFFKLKQGQESVSEWYEKVKAFAADCDFGHNLDEHIKNRFVCGMKSGPIMDRLCDEDVTTSSSSLLHIALVNEDNHQESLSQPLQESSYPVGKYTRLNKPVRQSPRRLASGNKENRQPESYVEPMSYFSRYQRYLNGQGRGNNYRNDDDERRGTKRPHNGDDDDDDAPAPSCICGLPAKRLTVRREGPNQGRDFFVCPNDDAKCSFYAWADEVSIQCFCQVITKKRTVRKDGPNQGREFYACAKNHEDPGRCQFFVWADEAESGNHKGKNNGGGGGGGGGGGAGGRKVNKTSFGGSRNNSFSNSRSKGRGGKGSSPVKRPKVTSKTPTKFRAIGGGKEAAAPKARKCGVCGQTGHNRKNCPQMTGD